MVSFPFLDHSIPSETSVYEPELDFIQKIALCAFRSALFFPNRFSLPERFCPAKWHKEYTSASFAVAAALLLVTISLMFPWYMRVSAGSGINENCQRGCVGRESRLLSRYTECTIKDFHFIVNLCLVCVMIL